MLQLKPVSYYNKNKEIFNKNYNSITKKYINRNKIGSCSYLFLKYVPDSYQAFADQYFSDYSDKTFNPRTCTGDKHCGRSVEQLVIIANKYHQEINDPNISLEQCFDDLVNHIIIETYDGHQAELYICNILKKYGKYEINTGVDDLDAVYGVDLVVKVKNTGNVHYIQVKPSSTFWGNYNVSLVEDRKNFFVKEQKLQESKNDKNIHIEYIIYDKIEYDYCKNFKFLKINGKFRHRLHDLCNIDGTMKVDLRFCEFENLI